MKQELTLIEAKEIINYIIDNNVRLKEEGKKPTAVDLCGPAGIGKTSIIEQIAEERGALLVKINLSELEEVGDLCGVPITEYYICKGEGSDEECMWVTKDLVDYYIKAGWGMKSPESRMSYAIPAWVPQDPEQECILLLDDYTRAEPRFLQATMTLIDRGEYLSWKLPKKCHVVLSSNPDDGQFSVSSIDAAQKSRYISFDIGFDVKVWSKWAEENQIDSRAINFALTCSEIFEEKNGKQEVNARSYVTFANAISGISDWSTSKNLGIILNIASGCFDSQDNVVGNLFTTFIANKLDKLISPEDMLFKDWEEVQKEVESQVYDGDKYRPDIAATLAIRFLNYTEYYFKKGGAKTDIATRRIIDFLDSDKTLLAEDLLFNLVKVLHKNFPTRCAKLMMNPKVIKYLL